MVTKFPCGMKNYFGISTNSLKPYKYTKNYQIIHFLLQHKKFSGVLIIKISIHTCDLAFEQDL